MGSCAFGTCTDPNCYLCRIMPLRFPQRYESCPKEVLTTTESGKKQLKACRLIKGHPRRCLPVQKTPAEKPDLRDGAPRLSAEKRRDPTFTPRHRVGPHR